MLNPLKEQQLKHIELFAGCGGMSLGLEAAGFELFFANELSPMAGETFAYNMLGEDLANLSEKKLSSSKVKWIKSQYPEDKLKFRLRENPFEATNGEYTDLKTIEDIRGKLLIGDIDNLLTFFNDNQKIVEEIRNVDIDLLSGGPPCQSFSLAGKREKNNHKNLLPLSFAKIAGLIQPKVVLLENVKGITSPFDEGGEKYYAWLEVCKAFALEGFVPVCMMLNSKFYGVAQNRPRFIMIAYRYDVFSRLFSSSRKNQILISSNNFYKLVKKKHNNLSDIGIHDFNYYDIDNDPELFDGLLFPEITNREGDFVSVLEAIGDIRRTEIDYNVSTIKKGYSGKINLTLKNKHHDVVKVQNHEPRNHNFGTKARFRFYQVINEFQNGLKKGATDLFTGKEIDDETKERLTLAFLNYNLYFKGTNGEFYKKPKTLSEVNNLLRTIPTKKHSQRALLEYEPAPAQLTIPDDLCHYHMENLRTLTVREMARFQSFPDWFVFRSKVTTGGDGRKFEVPQYTQVGNAVPPLLALSLGNMISRILNVMYYGKISED
ncbi:DNA cytosine methyltransferase [Pedobacter montanisoli]|uniref:Cytosine-specific methyltransferase n=1 Tax=Pedobacter montanisoli TaxID=2923277 RepID=A0ABS9ZTD3_9SPHI|nr:DNA cytosine methyltransferase [Pedobacter montanisoli]MCJ0741842.1 DNA cytosine methyltransferase [Pedobacter montanisoli]